MKNFKMGGYAIAGMALTCIMAGCTDTQIARVQALGEPQHVILYSGGKSVAEWTTSGKVLNEGNSDGYSFNDASTNSLVRVTGDVVVLLEVDYQNCMKNDDCQYRTK